MTIYSHLLNPDATCIPGVTCSADVHKVTRRNGTSKSFRTYRERRGT